MIMINQQIILNRVMHKLLVLSLLGCVTIGVNGVSAKDELYQKQKAARKVQPGRYDHVAHGGLPGRYDHVAHGGLPGRYDHVAHGGLRDYNYNFESANRLWEVIDENDEEYVKYEMGSGEPDSENTDYAENGGYQYGVKGSNKSNDSYGPANNLQKALIDILEYLARNIIPNV